MNSVFWISLVLLLYVYVGYPMLTWLVARFRPLPVLGANMMPDHGVSIIVVAHNEAGVLAQKLDSLMASTVEKQIFEILVASDASTDATVAVIHAAKDPRIRCLPFTERRGKAACINDAVSSATGHILVFTDARQPVAPDALEKLLQCLGDATVGVASAELAFLEDGPRSTTGEGMGAYWRYEIFLRRQESRVGSVPGATGALYAMRKALFHPLPADTILDDVFIPMKAVEQGYRSVLVSSAFVYDNVSETPAAEFTRKRRTLTGCVQLARRYPRWLLHPAFFHHKALRLLSPILLVGLLVGCWGVWEPLFWAQMLLYVAVAVAWMLSAAGVRIPLLDLVVHFVLLNLATLAALWDGLRGQYAAVWKSAR